MDQGLDAGDLLTVSGSVAAALITAVFLWVGTRGKTVADRETAREQTATEAWQAMAERTGQQLDDLTDRVDRLEETNRDLRSQGEGYRKHIYDWRTAVPDVSLWPAIPASIKDALD